MKILRSNLISALNIAISVQEEFEKEEHYTSDSAFVTGLKQIVKGLKNGKSLEIVDG